MCTYTEMVQRESERKGETKTQLTAYANMKKAGLADNTICSYMGITMHRLATLKKLLSDSINLELKTV